MDEPPADHNHFDTVHEHFDKDAGRITYVCDTAESFERLRAAVRRELGSGVTIEVFPAPVRAVSIELAEFVESVPPTTREKAAAWGCVVALVACGLIFLVGLLALIAWAVG